MLAAFRPQMEKSPAAHTGLLAALDFYLSSPTEVVFAGPKDEPAFKEMRRAVQEDYRPHKVLLWNENEKIQNELPLTEGRTAVGGKATVYLCQKQTCHPPVHSGQALTNLLEPPGRLWVRRNPQRMEK